MRGVFLEVWALGVAVAHEAELSRPPPPTASSAVSKTIALRSWSCVTRRLRAGKLTASPIARSIRIWRFVTRSSKKRSRAGLEPGVVGGTGVSDPLAFSY